MQGELPPPPPFQKKCYITTHTEELYTNTTLTSLQHLLYKVHLRFIFKKQRDKSKQIWQHFSSWQVSFLFTCCLGSRAIGKQHHVSKAGITSIYCGTEQEERAGAIPSWLLSWQLTASVTVHVKTKAMELLTCIRLHFKQVSKFSDLNTRAHA